MNKILEKYFFFVRHAETDWNSQKLCQGQKDISLNEKEMEEVRGLAEKSGDFDIDCIVTSPLSRALETAKEAQKAHPSAEFYTVPELSERFWGELEGIFSEEMYATERLEEDDSGYSLSKEVEPRLGFRLGPGGGEQVGYGHKGKGILIHFLVDQQENQLAASSISSGGDERKGVVKLLDKIPLRRWIQRAGKLSILEADKGYDSSDLRQALINRKILPVIPYRKNRKDKISLNSICSRFSITRKRWVVERTIAWIKRKSRRLLMRWERKFGSSGFVGLAIQPTMSLVYADDKASA